MTTLDIYWTASWFFKDASNFVDNGKPAHAVPNIYDRLELPRVPVCSIDDSIARVCVFFHEKSVHI